MRKNTIVVCALAALSVLSWSCTDTGVDHIHFGSRGDPLDGLTITWRGNHSHAYFRWGYTTEYEMGKSKKIAGRMEFGDPGRYLFDFTFPCLQAEQEIHYSIKVCSGLFDKPKYEGRWTRDRTFRTSGSTVSDRFTFIAGGDSRGAGVEMPDWRRVAAVLAATNADFYLYTGDLTLQGGDRRMWESWYEAGVPFLARNLVYHSAGNHERYGDPHLTAFREQFVLPENGDFTELYYSFEFGNAAFLVLNTEFDPSTEAGRHGMEKQTGWLRGELERYRDSNGRPRKEWVIVLFHKPFFTADKHMGEMTGGGRTNPEAPGLSYNHDLSQVWWKDLFDHHGVDVIINGHSHLYMRSVPLLLAGNAEGGGDVTFDEKGMPLHGRPAEAYGNRSGQGRLQIVTGGYGAPPVVTDPEEARRLRERKEYFSEAIHRDEWYVARGRCLNDFHYCEFTVDGKTLQLTVRNATDGSKIDSVTIRHE